MVQTDTSVRTLSRSSPRIRSWADYRRQAIVFVATLLFVGAGSLLASTPAADGMLDPSFGGYGEAGRLFTEPFPGGTVADAAYTTGGALIVVGSDGRGILVARYDGRGRLDPAFGTGGVTRLDFDNRTDTANAVHVGFDESIFVAGTTRTGPRTARTENFAVARLKPDGTPDPAFSQDGTIMVDFNGRSDVASQLVVNGNTIVVAGTVEQNLPGQPCNPSCGLDFGLAVINPNSTVVQVQHDFGGDDTLLDLAITGNSYYLAGQRTLGTTSEHVIARVSSDTLELMAEFNGTGYRASDEPASIVALLAVNPLANGSHILAAGSIGGDFGVLRFRPDGTLDPTWGNNGVLRVDIGGDDGPQELTQLTSDSYALIGVSDNRLGMVRITEQGQLSPDSASRQEIPGTGAELARALATQRSDEVRLTTVASIKAEGEPRLALLRSFADGSLDAGGRQTFGFASMGELNDRATHAVFQPDGKLLVAGVSPVNQDDRHVVLVRFTVAGELDPSFGEAGKLALPALRGDASGLALLGDGKILVGGGTFNVARLNPDGSPDTSFNGTGFARLNLPDTPSYAMVVQPDGKLVLAGGANVMVVARLTAQGQLDRGFGFNGVQFIGAGVQAIALGIAFQPDGKLLVAGTTVVSQTDANMVLARLNPDGSQDRPFGTEGKVTADFGTVEIAYAVVVQPNGAIVAAGASRANGAAFVRYRPDGSPDRSFDGDGRLLVQITGTDAVRALLADGGGITAALCQEFSEEAGLVIRLQPDGSADTSINGNGRLPFSFGGADCPFGLARGDGRLAAVGQACSPLLDRRDCSGLDFAVAVYRQAVTPAPPTPLPTSPMPSPTPVPADEGLYLPLIRR
ncbi:MAG: hypothetical protein OHK0015_44450 [Chloroflexi bacterium OHK40]